MEKIRILLVDDEAEFINTIAKRMRKRGLEPNIVTSAQDCLEFLEHHPIDVVVMDVKMPGMGGLEALKIIKDKYLEKEVILLTGHATSSREGVEGIKTGAFDYLTKPIELEHLLSKIKHAHEKILREEEKKNEAEFRVKMEQQMIAAERLASIGTLASGVAHEINNPLAIINESAGWIRLIIDKTDEKEMPRKKDFEMAISKIETGIRRAKRITHDLLGVVRESGPDFIFVDLAELVGEAVELVHRDAVDKSIEIITQKDPDLGNIQSDPPRIRQILINLLTNAIHATPTKGTISITLKSNNDKALLIIKDTGEGIPKENMNKIFEPFFSTKSPGKGTGLGLFVTRGIIEKLGGSISLESQVGKGSTFYVNIPKTNTNGDKLDIID